MRIQRLRATSIELPWVICSTAGIWTGVPRLQTHACFSLSVLPLTSAQRQCFCPVLLSASPLKCIGSQVRSEHLFTLNTVQTHRHQLPGLAAPLPAPNRLCIQCLGLSLLFFFPSELLCTGSAPALPSALFPFSTQTLFLLQLFTAGVSSWKASPIPLMWHHGGLGWGRDRRDHRRRCLVSGKS